ncbi:uncharacterized protein OCT59_011121 [Rhizophagus irregularis]|uniref:uncharacterized protein n=1 Tax=Rhizophagus irregularis TaxID=588596 RepID=UPI000CC4EA17|nr:hypothetical protein OCT59_011121 [Rhizophagus irregularis]GBC23506.1 hypothetical protein RIR_jg23141.t1 [Rhizophagus irregularis DAOM 181602=DAOM 197198]
MSNYSSLSRILSPFRVQTLSPSQEQTKIEEISLPASQPYLYRKLIWKELVGNEEGSNKANQWTLWKVEDFIEALEDIEDSNTETFIKHNSMVKSYGP